MFGTRYPEASEKVLMITQKENRNSRKNRKHFQSLEIEQRAKCLERLRSIPIHGKKIAKSGKKKKKRAKKNMEI